MALNTPMLSPVQYAVTSSQDPAGSNLITVEVTTVNDVSGDHCLDLQDNGTIFIIDDYLLMMIAIILEKVHE
ncbi:MAG: hypothetical protein HC818_05590 [Synechococcaceae cyanobacterium RM1_1_27]|nr:hypothetical protein [Synechococcaceae cyanobacterium RM1_1_27]